VNKEENLKNANFTLSHNVLQFQHRNKKCFQQPFKLFKVNVSLFQMIRLVIPQFQACTKKLYVTMMNNILIMVEREDLVGLCQKRRVLACPKNTVSIKICGDWESERKMDNPGIWGALSKFWKSIY